MNYTIKNPTKIALYTQKKGSAKTIAQIATSVKADVICNFQMFGMQSGIPCFYLKQDGEVLTDDGINYKGYGWNKNDTTITYDCAHNASKYDNFVGCLSVLENGVANTQPTTDTALLGVRGRTCIGTKSNGEIVIYCWPDGSTGACQLSELGAKMKALGCVNAVSYDGGGSTQLICPDGKVTTTRTIYNFLYFQLADASATIISYNATVKANIKLNVRKYPYSSSTLMGTIAKDSIIKVNGKSIDGNWYHCDKGWIYIAYTAPYIEKNTMEDDEDMTQDKFNEMFTDFRKTLQDNDSANWSDAAREWAKSNKIFNGDENGNYMWQDFVTREQMAQLLYNFAKLMGKA